MMKRLISAAAAALMLVFALLTAAVAFAEENSEKVASDFSGSAAFVREYGRGGTILDSGGAVSASMVSKEAYDMNIGVTIRFRVTSEPGMQGDVDAWLGIFLHEGTSDNPEYGGVGFKFLLRDSNPNAGNPGTAVQRFIRTADTADSDKNPMLSPTKTKVPLLNNEHYITIFRTAEGEGFIVNIDGTYENYYEHVQASRLNDLSEAHVVVKAYTAASKAASCPSWRVEFEKISAVNRGGNWLNSGTAYVEGTENSLSVTEKTGTSGSGQAIFYQKPMSVEKTFEATLKLDAVPARSDDTQESYVAVLFSTETMQMSVDDVKTVMFLFKVDKSGALTGCFGVTSMAFGNDITLGVSAQSELKLAFGFNEDGLAVLTLNRKVVASTKSLKKNNFLDKKGYLSVITYNDASQTGAPNWAYSLRDVRETNTAMPVISEKGKEGIEEGGDMVLIVCLSVAGVVVLATVAAAIYFVKKRKGGKR